MAPSLRMRARVVLSMLLKPALMSKNREDPCSRGLCRVFTSLTSVSQMSSVLSPGREPHWFGCIKPFVRAAIRRWAATILSRIFVIVGRTTMILKEEGDW